MKNLGIYIHIPFCERKCLYCDFLSAPASEETKHAYVDSLMMQIKKSMETVSKTSIDTVFFGGGTPSILPGSEIVRIMDCLRDHAHIMPDAEITIEANPATLNREKLNLYKQAGVNRLSLGVQSFDDAELSMLGRIHDSASAQESYHLARECGFDNISLDLMSGIPGQSVEKFEKSLRRAVELEPQHLSVYGLIVEDGTYLGEHLEKFLPLPSDEEDREIYHKTKELLLQAGYVRYEISNYAKQGFKSRHNLKYWSEQEYIGLGLGASSFYQNVRCKTHSKLEKYLENDYSYEEEICLDRKDLLEEYMFLGLRRMEGIDVEKFAERFGTSLDEIYGPVVEKLVKNGLLTRDNHRICLTEYGIDVSNAVFVEFLL